MSNQSLKRPRPTTSNPPSPSTSSSSKRAASDFDDQSHQQESSSADTTATEIPPHSILPSSSPRMSGSTEDGSWVQKTENVHLNSDAAVESDVDQQMTENDNIHQQIHDLLTGAASAEYARWTSCYLIPVTVAEKVKSLAAGAEVDKTSVLNISSLLQSTDGEELHVAVLHPSNDDLPKVEVRKQRFWQLKDGLQEEEDFSYVSPEVWKQLKEVYGPYDGPELSRTSVPDRSGIDNMIELQPPLYSVHLGSSERTDLSKVIKLVFSAQAPVQTLYSAVIQAIEKDMTPEAKHSRIWHIDANLDTTGTIAPDSLLVENGAKLLYDEHTSSTVTCDESGLLSGDTIALEIGKASPVGGVIWQVDVNADKEAVKKSIAPVPSAPPPLFSQPPMYSGSSTAESSKSGSSRMTRSQTKSSRKGKGLVGLVNLGNTCFMNSAVQCLSNTSELRDYFLSGVYRSELNADNPLGMGGQIANSFGGTIESLWSSASSSSISPRQLKYCTSRFAPQFAGYGQHDTQEFIAFLLDGLHEDLNRIHKKPYIEKPDWKPGGGDKELAELGKECWEGYKKRNDSVIVDLFQGQLKSTLVCPVCTKESVTLDPFMYLTVPLPIAQTRIFKCHFVPKETDRPALNIRLLIPQNASFMQVKEKLGQLMQCDPTHIVGFDLWKNLIYTWWLDSDHNGECKDSDEPVFYELAVPTSSTRKAVGTIATDATITVPVFTLTTTDNPARHHDPPANPASPPFYITVTKAEATDPVAVREAITKGYSRLIKEDMRSRMWVASGSNKAATALPHMIHDDGPVTEIHIEGDEARVVEACEPSTTDSQTLRSIGSSTSLSTLASAKSGKMVPRGDLFKVHVAEASTSEDRPSSFNVFKGKDDVIPLFKSSGISSLSSNWSQLENRRKVKRNMFGHVAAGFKSIIGSSTPEEEPSPPATPISPPLVIRPGEGIFCEWNIRKHQEYFEDVRQYETLEDPAIAKDLAKKKEGKAISLDDCLDEFSKEEILGKDDLWYCPQCKEHRAASKKLEVYQAPDILVICIKRFGSSRRLHDKLTQLVNFPIEGLDLTDRVGERLVAKSLNLSAEEAKQYGMEASDEPVIYDLYAVDNHFGGLGGGHYTAFCKNSEDGQWYNYDDSRASQTTPDSIQSRAAYLLFYRRRTTRPIGGISRIKAEEASRAASPEPEETTQTSSDNDDRPIGLRLRDHNHEATSSSNAELTNAFSSPSASTPSTPNLPSPNLSDDGLDGEQSTSKTLTGVGSYVGFGNTAWGSSQTAAPNASSIHHGFGGASTSSTSISSGEKVNLPATPPSPPQVDRPHSQPHQDPGESQDHRTSSADGSGDFEMVSRAESDADSEIVHVSSTTQTDP